MKCCIKNYGPYFTVTEEVDIHSHLLLFNIKYYNTILNISNENLNDFKILQKNQIVAFGQKIIKTASPRMLSAK